VEEEGVIVNVTKLLAELKRLKGCKPNGASLDVGEIWEGGPQVLLTGLSDGVVVEFTQRLSIANFPSDWLSTVSSADVAFEQLSRSAIEATRRILVDRITTALSWGLSLPNVAEEDLLEQGAHIIVKLEDLETLAFPWCLDVNELNYHSESVQLIPLSLVLTSNELQRIFTACRR